MRSLPSCGDELSMEEGRHRRGNGWSKGERAHHCRVSGLLEPRRAADCLQRTLVPRSRFRQQLTPSVRPCGREGKPPRHRRRPTLLTTGTVQDRGTPRQGNPQDRPSQDRSTPRPQTSTTTSTDPHRDGRRQQTQTGQDKSPKTVTAPTASPGQSTPRLSLRRASLATERRGGRGSGAGQCGA